MKLRRSWKSLVGLSIMGLILQACGKLPFFQTTPKAEVACGFVQNVYGQRIAWKGSTPIRLSVHESFPTEYNAALQRAIQHWETALGKPLFQVVQYGVSGPLTPKQDGVSMIYYMNTWESTRASEQARTSIYWSGNVLQEADMRINAYNFHFYDQNPTSTSDVHMESLLIHELGHILGLKHNDLNGSVMATYLSAATIRTNIAQVDLQDAHCEY